MALTEPSPDASDEEIAATLQQVLSATCIACVIWFPNRRKNSLRTRSRIYDLPPLRMACQNGSPNCPTWSSAFRSSTMTWCIQLAAYRVCPWCRLALPLAHDGLCRESSLETAIELLITSLLSWQPSSSALLQSRLSAGTGPCPIYHRLHSQHRSALAFAAASVSTIHHSQCDGVSCLAPLIGCYGRDQSTCQHCPIDDGSTAWSST